MNRYLLSTVSAFLLLWGEFLAAEPIPAQKLFRQSAVTSFELSPDASLVATFLDNGVSRTLLVYDPKIQKSYALHKFRKSGSGAARSYFWIDDDTLFVDYYAGDASAGAIVHLLKTKDGITSKSSNAQAKGYILDALPERDNTVVFASRVGGEKPWYRVYTANTSHLERGNFKGAVQLSNTLSNASYYFTGYVNEIMMGTTVDDSHIHHHYKTKDNRWIKFWSQLRDSETFVPVGTLDNDKIAVLSDNGIDRVALRSFNLHTKAFEELLYQHDSYDLHSAGISKKQRNLKFVRFYDHGRLVSHFFSDENNKSYKLLKRTFKNKQVVTVSEAENTDKSIVFVFASDDPGTYYLFDAKTKKAQILDMEHPQLQQYALASTEAFTVEVKEDTNVEALLTRPVGNSNRVLLVMPHGGPIGVRDTAAYNPQVQYFASRGYSVLRVNYSGSAGFGRRFQQSGVGEFGKAIERDIDAAVDQIWQKYGFERACAMGASYGAYSAMMLTIENPERYHCAIGAFGVYDLPLMFNASNLSLRQPYQRALTNTLGEFTPNLREQSPTYLAEKLSRPVLLIAGSQDRITDYEQTNRLNYLLNALNKPVEYVLYEGTGHGHMVYSGDMHTAAMTDEFIRRTLNLPIPEGSNSEKIIASEYELIGRTYEREDNIADDYAKAFEFYSRAAALNDRSAMYKLGRMYWLGKHVSKSPEMALEWFQKSSDAGYKSASFKLGRVHGNNKKPEYDVQKSLHYFELAETQGHSLAHFELARFHCVGNQESSDFSQCVEKLAMKEEGKKYTDEDWGKRNEMLSELLWDPLLSDDKMQALQQMLTDAWQVAEFDPKANVRAQFVDKWDKKSGYYFERRGNEVPLRLNARFGIRLKLKGKSSNGSNKAIFLFKWTSPAQHPDEASTYTSKHFSILPIGEQETYSYRLNKEWEIVPGVWKIEGFTVGGKKLFEKTFQSQADP